MNAPSAIAVPPRVKTILAMITTAAEHGDECPTNFFLANGAGCSVGSVLNTISLLETMNAISVERGRNWRIVTIVATGRSTKKPGRGGLQLRSNARAIRHANQRIRINLFADALSEGAGIKEAGRVAGVSEPTAHKFFKTICAELGWVG